MPRPRSSRQRFQAFLEDYRKRRLDAVADGEKKPLEPPKPSANGAPEAKAQKRAKRREYLREYLRWLWPHRWAVGAVFLLALFAAGLQMIEPLFMRFIIDGVLL